MSDSTPAMVNTPVVASAAANGDAHDHSLHHKQLHHEDADASATPTPTSTSTSTTAELTYPTLLSMLVVRDARGAIAFYEKALNAQVKAKYDAPNGSIMHSYLYSPLGGGFHFCVEDHDALPEFSKLTNVHAADQAATHASALYLYVSLNGKGTCQDAVERMREAGAVVTMEPKNTFWGVCLGKCLDPYGVAWDFAEKLVEPTPSTTATSDADATATAADATATAAAADPGDNNEDKDKVIETDQPDSGQTDAAADPTDMPM